MVSTSTSVPSGSAWAQPTSRPFLVLGALGVVGGGLLSAMTAAAPSYHASWAVAYIVLVVGVAQIMLGVAQASLTGGLIRSRIIVGEAICWNLGNAVVLTGTLTSVPTLLYAGIILLLVALVLFAAAIRHGRRGILFTATWVVIIILLISMPVGAIIQAVTG
jgi:hypothetical protein